MCVAAWLHGCGWAYDCSAKGCAHNGLQIDVTTMDGSPLTGKAYTVELQSADREFDDVCDFDVGDPTGCAFGQFSQRIVSVPMDGEGPISVNLPEGPKKLHVVVTRDGRVVLDETLTPKYHASILDNGDAPECKGTCQWADPQTLTMTD
jgi:hypothetical protein